MEFGSCKFLLPILLLLTSCPPPPTCTPNDTRCINNTAEICSPDNEWLVFMDCGDVNLTCQEIISAGHTCLPVLRPEGP